MTYDYGESTAVVGPLALRAEPGTYDLCAAHCRAMSTPRGWELIRLPVEEASPGHNTDDLLALADAVREVGLSYGEPASVPSPSVTRRRGHLGLVADPPPHPG